MPILFIPIPMRDLTGGLARAEVEGSTVGEAIEALDLRFPGFQARACRAGSLAPGLQVAVDGVMTTRGLRATLRPESEVYFLPVIGGGEPAPPA